jgi:NADH dehydrogenase [ubiquinone] 1 alpha subcomplex assembly factor 7
VNALGERIASLIAAQGPLSIAQFMTMAALDPQYGYYTTRDPLGAAAISSPRRKSARCSASLWGCGACRPGSTRAGPRTARLVELGPGTGSLMEDALRAAKLAPEFREAVEVVMVDANPRTRRAAAGAARQRGRFRDVARNSTKASAIWPLFLIANEFFDALPIRQFVQTARGWCENMVTLDANQNLALALSPDPLPLDMCRPGAAKRRTARSMKHRLPPPRSRKESAAPSPRAAVRALIVDYGYSGAGFGDTLQAVGEHQFRDVFDPRARSICRRMSISRRSHARRSAAAR